MISLRKLGNYKNSLRPRRRENERNHRPQRVSQESDFRPVEVFHYPMDGEEPVEKGVVIKGSGVSGVTVAGEVEGVNWGVMEIV